MRTTATLCSKSASLCLLFAFPCFGFFKASTSLVVQQEFLLGRHTLGLFFQNITEDTLIFDFKVLLIATTVFFFFFERKAWL